MFVFTSIISLSFPTSALQESLMVTAKRRSIEGGYPRDHPKTELKRLRSPERSKRAATPKLSAPPAVSASGFERAARTHLPLPNTTCKQSNCQTSAVKARRCFILLGSSWSSASATLAAVRKFSNRLAHSSHAVKSPRRASDVDGVCHHRAMSPQRQVPRADVGQATKRTSGL